MRSKALAIESIAVMLVLIILAAAVFVIIGAGSGAYDNIINDKANTHTSRVAYSYINMKIKQNDAASKIDVVTTEFGSTLKLELAGIDFDTYIFFYNGTLYECISPKDVPPKVEAANKITELYDFEISREGSRIHIVCVSQSGDKMQTFEGIVGLRT